MVSVMSVVHTWRRLLCRIFGHRWELHGTPVEETLVMPAPGGEIISTKAFGAVTIIEVRADILPPVVTFHGLLDPCRVCRRCGFTEGWDR